MSRAPLPVLPHASRYWQRHDWAYPVDARLLSQLDVKLDERALAVFVPFGALNAGRKHLLDFSENAFAYPFKVMVTVLLAAAHATANSCRLAVVYAPCPSNAVKSDSGYFLVLYPKTSADMEEDMPEEEVPTAYSARGMSAHEWISERLMKTVHAGSPTKHPAHRLATIEAAAIDSTRMPGARNSRSSCPDAPTNRAAPSTSTGSSRRVGQAPMRPAALAFWRSAFRLVDLPMHPSP